MEGPGDTDLVGPSEKSGLYVWQQWEAMERCKLECFVILFMYLKEESDFSMEHG